MKKIILIAVWLLVSALTVHILAPEEVHADWLDPAWPRRSTVAVSNPGGSPLSNFQIHLSLDSAFDFAQANVDGSDVRFTSGDGTTLIPFWIESWNAGTKTASIWINVPAIPPSGATVYLYYGNSAAVSASNGNATFEFFDDFESGSTGTTMLGYYNLGEPQTVLVRDQGWEGKAPHTLSVVQNNSGGYTYWGYYGLQAGCGGVGLAFSNDLVNWTKHSGNPLFLNGRWPSVLKAGNIFYMLYTRDYCATSYINLAVSSDGINFSDVKTVKLPQSGRRNQNPNLFYNPNDGKYYMYWYSGNDKSFWEIRARSAASPEGLDNPSSETIVLRSTKALAAPNMLFRDGTYFLSTEIIDSSGQWATHIYSSASPISGFSLLPGNPVLSNGSACNFQHVVGTQLHDYYCKLTGSKWTVDHRVADLTEGRLQFQEQVLDPSKWTASGGLWTNIMDTQQDGAMGNVVQGSVGDSVRQVLSSSYQGSDYVVEVYGKQVSGRVWGLGVRGTDQNNLYSVNLFEDLDGTDNLYVYNWVNGTAVALASTAAGVVNADSWYKLTVKAHGNSLDVYKDGVPMIRTSSSQYGAGVLALYGERNTVAEFNNLLVRKYAAVEPLAAVSVNALPMAVDDAYGTNANTTLDQAAPGVLGNDTSPAGATLTAQLVSGPSHGALTLNADGSFTYTPAADYAGSDSFTYRAGDGTNSSNIATVTLTVSQTIALSSLSLNPISVAGGSTSQGTVTLSGPAPSGGAAVALSSDNAAASVPAGITVPGGSTSATFTITTTAVSSSTTVTVTAVYGGVTKAATLTVTTTAATTEAVGLIRQNCTGYASCYTSLAAWEAAYGGIDFGTCAQGDLACVNKIAVARIEGTWTAPDTAPAIINGWTTDASHYIRIYTAPEARHQGKWSTDKYRLEVSGSTAIQCSEQYVRFEGLQIQVTASSGVNRNGIYVDSGVTGPGEIHISQSIFKGVMSGKVDYSTALSLHGTSMKYKVWNILCYDWVRAGAVTVGGVYVANTGALYCFNATCYNCGYAYWSGSSDAFFEAKNCVAQNNANDGFSGTFSANSNYNISDRAGDAPGTNSKNGVAVTFVDAANKDFHLSLSDTAAGDAGVNLSADLNLAFSDDIEGTARPDGTAWDIGADEAASSNIPPMAVDDAYGTNANTTLDQAAPGVLGNDTSPTGATLTAQLVSGPSHGALTLNADGSFTYTPAADYAGSDSFTYRASDGTNSSNIATVTLAISNPVPPLDHIVIGPSSGSITAGESQAFTTQAFDQYNNSLGDVTGMTTFTISPDGSCTGASCTAVVAGAHIVTASYDGKTVQASLQVNPAALSNFLVKAAGGGDIAPQTAGVPFDIRITARDQYNNIVTSFTGTVQIGSNGVLSGAPVISGAFEAGELATQSVTINSAQLGTTLSATGPGEANGTSNSFTVNAAGLGNFLVEAATGGNIGPQTAGVAFSIKITARDQYNNTVNSFNGTATLETTAGAISPTSVTFLSGVSTLSVAVTEAGSLQNITAISDTHQGTSNEFTVSPAGLGNFLITNVAGGSIDPQTAGVPFDIKITARDQYNNVIQDFSGTVALSTNADSITPASVTFTGSEGGFLTPSVTLSRSGIDKTITAISDSHTGQSNTFTVNAGVLTHFKVEAAGGGDIGAQTAGSAFGIQITAQDANNNTAVSFNDTVDISSTGSLSAGSGTTAAFTNGMLTSHSVAILNAGSFTITATKTGGIEAGASNTFTVNNPVPALTDISPASKTSGEAEFTLTVNGNGYAADSVIQWNGESRTTTYVSSNQLTAVIPAADIATAGTAQVTVFNPAPGGGTSNSQTFITE